jgi:predicted nucleotidyltransferase
MIDIEKLKSQIVKALMPLNPDKIILFGSYAYGTPNENSDIDLFLIKNNLSSQNIREYELKAHLSVMDLIRKYHIGFDILADTMENLQKREDYFHKVDILQNGKVLNG